MKRILFNLIFILFLTACSSAPPTTHPQNAIDTAVAATVAAQPSSTAEASPTPAMTTSATIQPSATARPTNTSRPTEEPAISVEEAQSRFIKIIVDNLEDDGDIERVNLARFDDGVFEMELHTAWASKDSQPDVSYDVVQFLAVAISGVDDEKMKQMADGDRFAFSLTTYSTDGDYRYRSETDLATLRKVEARAISYEEWVEASGAGFR
jgi:hypothetical protein